MPGVPGRRRARCVARGFQETVNEIGDSFSPVCRHETVRAFYASIVYHDYAMRSIDICQAFLTATPVFGQAIQAMSGHVRPCQAMAPQACQACQAYLSGLSGLPIRPRQACQACQAMVPQVL